MKQLNKLIKHDLVRGLKDVTFEKDKLCSACQAGKQVGNTHPKKSMMSTSKAFELMHMDLFGPTTYTSIGGNKYGFVIVDDFTRYTWVFFLGDKSDVFVTLFTPKFGEKNVGTRSFQKCVDRRLNCMKIDIS